MLLREREGERGVEGDAYNTLHLEVFTVSLHWRWTKEHCCCWDPEVGREEGEVDDVEREVDYVGGEVDDVGREVDDDEEREVDDVENVK